MKTIKLGGTNFIAHGIIQESGYYLNHFTDRVDDWTAFQAMANTVDWTAVLTNANKAAEAKIQEEKKKGKGVAKIKGAAKKAKSQAV